MKTLITAAIISLTATLASAHDIKTSATDDYKLGYCFTSIAHDSFRTHDLIGLDQTNLFMTSLKYLKLSSDAYYDGFAEARGRALFEPIQAEEALECVALAKSLAKLKYEASK